ncbi:hypothetical protein [Erythrobacter sp.]|uniref:hypothetical protein n=1 Tax=Erythrobacter sp. TaxID=1042 RepID=UPI001B09D4E3|nr:hypothetical protein [Erythrobacter sp.]MBO6527192.1 hypothetical protein [Erythrobacter sp.]MBO6531420.1 hypothetical protein [Erythrobacter sp.]
MANSKKGSARRRPPKSVWMPKFLAALSETSNVSGAARRAEIDTSAVYKERRENAEFNRQWQVALAEGYDNLEMDLLHRLRIGQLEGGKAQARRKYDNAIAFRLLTAHRETVSRQRAIRSNEDEEAIIRSLNAKLEKMRQRQLAAEARNEATGSDDR